MVLGILARAVKVEKEIKDIESGNEEVKLSMFAYDMLLYMENPKYSTNELLELIDRLSEVASYCFLYVYFVPFLYANDELIEKSRKIPFTMATQKSDF